MTGFRLHGANPEKLYEAFGIPMPEKICDFSTNTNVVKWNGSCGFDLAKILSEYPDDDSSELRALIAEQNGCSAENALVTNGSNEAIYLLASCLTGGLNCLLQPLYGEYGRALSAFGARTVDASSLSALPRSCASVWICNPCNPTGKFIENGELEQVLSSHKETLFIVDEAYRPLMLEEREPLDFLRYPNLVLLRSLTKIYHLCGVRIGYALAASDVISRLKLRQPTWSVNAFAQKAAAAYMKDAGFAARTRDYYRREVPRLRGLLNSCGFNAHPTCVNFFLVETEDDEKLIAFLLKRGVVVRHTRNFRGLDGRFVRIAARTGEEDDLLAKYMDEFHKTYSQNKE